jgi:hypothetical protein
MRVGKRALPGLLVIAAFVLSAASVAVLGATHYYWSIKVDNAAREHAEEVVTNGK